MTVLFDGNDDRLAVASTPVTAVPLSVHVVAKNTGLGAARLLFEINNSSTTDYFRCFSNASNQASASTSAASATSACTTSTAVADANYHAYGFVFGAINSRASYIDGAGKGTNSGSRTPTGLNAITMGLSTAETLDWSGVIGHVALWNVALTDADFVNLAAGQNPQAISGLVGYWGMFDPNTYLVDVIGGRTLTLPVTTNGNTASYSTDNPTVYIPAWGHRANVILGARAA